MPPSPLTPFSPSRLKGRATPKTWEAARELAASGKVTWRWTAAPDKVEAVGEVPATNRSPFKVKVTWSGASLRTACSCPSRRRQWLCSHRVALGLLLHEALTRRAASAQPAAAPSVAPPTPNAAPAPTAVQTPPNAAPAAAAPSATAQPAARPATAAQPAAAQPTTAKPAAQPAAPVKPAPLHHQLSYQLHLIAGTRRMGGLALEVLWWLPGAPNGMQPIRPGQLNAKDPGLLPHDREMLKLMGGFKKKSGSSRSKKKPAPWPIPTKYLDQVLDQLQAGPCQLLPSSPLRLAPGRLQVRLEARPEARGALRLRAWLEGPIPANRASQALLLGAGLSAIVLLDGMIYRLEQPFDARLWIQLRGDGDRLPQGRIDAFLQRWVAQLEPFGLSGKANDARSARIVRDASPAPVLLLAAEEGKLVARLEFSYADDVPRVSAARAESETMLQDRGRTVLITRDRYLENQLEWQLIDRGLTLLGGGAFTCKAELLPAFALETVPRLEQKGWRIEGQEALATLGALPVDLTVKATVRRRIDWFRFELTAEADGARLPIREVITAWKAGKRYLPLPGGRYGKVPQAWLEKAGDLAEAIDALPADETGGVRVAPWHVPLAAALTEQLERADIDPAFTQVRQRMEARLEALASDDAFPLPHGLNATLRPYQLTGYRWLRQLCGLELGGILADDMGLGKTLQVLAALLAEKEAGKAGPSLVVVPTSVIENWAREAGRFTPALKVVIFHGTGRHDDPAIASADLLITSYGSLRRDLEFHAERTYHYLILDEAQAIKNPESDTAKACRKVTARHRLTMTGTPIENRLSELWSQFNFLMPALLGSMQVFQARYATPIEREGSTMRRAELSRRVGPFILRRLKEEVAPDLPPLTEGALFCDLNPDQATLYAATLQASRQRIFEAIDAQGMDRARFTVLEALLKLRQICCHPTISGLVPEGATPGSAKLELFQETLEEILAEGHRVLVFSQFVEMLKVLSQRLADRGVQHLYLDGQTKGRQGLVDRFNETSIPVFLISLKAGGAGLNLTGADYVLHYDPWWNPAVEAQATDRAHRIGQTRPVIAYKLITRGTVEEKMLELHERKRALVEGLLAGDEGIGRGLTREDLEYLL